jgi:cytochrome P450
LISGIAHRATESLTVGDFVIPKNATLLFNIYSIHMDETYWENPFEFKPERFLSQNGDLILHENFIPFGEYCLRFLTRTFH